MLILLLIFIDVTKDLIFCVKKMINTEIRSKVKENHENPETDFNNQLKWLINIFYIKI